jgi:hypothetical protein
MWHIPRHPSLRVYQWVEPLYNRTILYSVYILIHTWFPEVLYGHNWEG